MEMNNKKNVDDTRKTKIIGYFTCPVCEKENNIDGWSKDGENSVTIVFSEKTYTKMTFFCEHCGSTWRLGIKEYNVQ